MKKKSPLIKYGKLTIDLDETFGRENDSLGKLLAKAVRSACRSRSDLRLVHDGSERRCLAEWAIGAVCKLVIYHGEFQWNWSLGYATSINAEDRPELRKAAKRRGITEFDMAREAISEWAEARREFTAKLGKNDDDDNDGDEWKQSRYSGN